MNFRVGLLFPFLALCVASSPASPLATADLAAHPSATVSQPAAGQSGTAQSATDGVRTIIVTRNGKKSTFQQRIRTINLKRGQTFLSSPAHKAEVTPRVSRPKSITVHARAHTYSTPATSRVHPRFGGPGTPTVNSVNFGSSQTNADAVTMTLSYPQPDADTTYTFAIFAGTNFTLNSASCDGSDTCTASVSFAPLAPGVLRDALLVTDQNKNFVYETFLYGNGVAPQFGYDFGGETYVNFSGKPAGIAIGPDGSFYLGDQANNQVQIYPHDLSAPASAGFTGLGTPAGVAVDGYGTVFVADQTNNRITYITRSGFQANVTTSALSGPQGITIDGTGALYICDTGNNRIIKIDNQGAETSVLDDATSPQSVAVDSAGDIYYADLGSGGEIIELPNDSDSITIGDQLGQIQGLALDAGNRVYYTYPAGFGTIDYQYGTSTTTGNSEMNNGPYAIAVDNDGDLITTQPADGEFIFGDRTTSNFVLNSPPNTITAGYGAAENTGNDTLTISSASIPGPVFSLNTDQTTCKEGESLAAGQPCSFVVDFTPPDDQSYQQSLAIGSNSLYNGDTVDDFTVYGNGIGYSTSTTLTTSGMAALVNTPVTLTATVANTGGYDGTPTGSVNFTDNNNFLATVQLAQGSTTATYTTSALPSGANEIQAVYSGDSFFAGSQSAFQNVQVDPSVIQTAVTLSVSPATVSSGQTETLTALIAGEYTQPTGTVTFSDQHGVLGTVTVTGSGQSGSQAVLTLGNLIVGSHTITATYNGDATFAASTSAAKTVTVTGISTTSALSASAATVGSGDPETFTITVTPAMVSGMQPDGSATYLDTDGTVLGTSYFSGYSPISTFTTYALTVGQHTITAVYSGDQTYAGSTSPSVAVSVISSTTLTVTPATTTYQTPVTFQIHVETASTYGQVILCDAAAPQCSILSNLAIVQVGEEGVATVKLPAGTIGTHNFIATFLGVVAGDGTPALSPSTSAPATVTVTGKYPSTAAIAVTGAQDPYTLTGTVVGLGSNTLSPTGAVTFNDTTNTAAPLLGTANLGASTLAFSAAQPTGSPYTVGTAPLGVATGDFNGDGFADIVITNQRAGSISILLGLGNGAFMAPVTYAVGDFPESVKVADLNADGFADIIVANNNSADISILLGNGDGTFQAPVTYPVGNVADSSQALIVADFNGDGLPDIAVAVSSDTETFAILLNDGDGTFQPGATYFTGSAADDIALAQGDFNGDGIADIAVTVAETNTLSIYLGTGDGTFTAGRTYPTGKAPSGVSVGDFNGDGKFDLAVANNADKTVSVLLGNGDGTFKTPSTLSIPSTSQVPVATPYQVFVADFNGDGKQDLYVSLFNPPTAAFGGAILLGNGDGTFQTPYTFSTTDGSYGSAVADFNGDGFPDLAVSLFGSNHAAVFLSQVTQTATATLSTPVVGVGTHNLDAVYAGDTGYTGSTSPTTPLVTTSNATVSPGTSTIIASGGVAPGSPTDYTFFGNMNVEFGAGGGGQPTKLTNYTVNTLTNVEYQGNGNYTSITAPGGTAPFTTGSLTENPTNYPTTTPHTTLLATFSPLHAGTFTVYILDGNTDGVYVGNSTVGLGVNGGAEVATASKALSGTNEFTAYTVTGASPSDVFQVYATTSTNAYPTIGALTFSGVAATLSPSITTLTATPATQTAGGTITLSVKVAGSAQTAPIPTGTVTLINSSVTPNVTIGAITLISGAGALNVSTLPPGANIIVAKYSGDTAYAASNSAAQTVTITTAQTITFPPIPNHTVGDAPFTLSATASSGLAITYTVISGPATLSGNVVTLTGAGAVTIQASQPGNSKYAAATPVSRTFTVSPSTALSLTSITPNSGAIGSPATTITLTGVNFSTADVVLLNGASIASTLVSPTSLTAIIPAGFFIKAGVGQVTVHDPETNITSAALPFTVSTSPEIVFTGPPTAPSGQQPKLTFTLVNPYPVALAGTLTLTFAPATSTGINDPSVQFSTGGRTLVFNIPANSTVTPTVQLQTGTVAGTATIDLALTANGVSVTPANVAPVVIAIPAAAPTITSTSVKRQGNTLTVSVVGFSNTREALKAVFDFTPVAGGDITTPTLTLDVTSSFTTWYSTTGSDAYGSAFTYTQIFTLDQDASVVGSVKVTLSNTVGTSTPATTQ